MSKFAVLASPPSSRSSSAEREDDVLAKEVENEEVVAELNQQQSERKKDANPVEKVAEKDSDSISLNLGSDNWSPIHRINGYPWRLHLYYNDNEYFVEVHCDKTTESELWQCTATIELTSPYYKRMEVELNRWAPHVLIASSGDKQWKKVENERNRTMGRGWRRDRIPHVVKITPKKDGNKWARRQTFNPSEPYDGVIKIGKELKEIQIHRGFLAAHSPLFLKEFFENYKETDITEIAVTDVEFDLFASMIRIFYEVHTVSPQNCQDMNSADFDVRKVLELAQRFHLKTVENRCVSFLLSSECSMPIHERLVISEELNLQFLKEYLLKQYKPSDIVSLSNSDEFDKISPESLKVLFDKSKMNLFGNGPFMNIGLLTSGNRIQRDPSAIEESNSISVVVSSTTTSIAKRINGFPWRLKVDKSFSYGFTTFDENVTATLTCDKASEAELWKCTAIISSEMDSHRETRTLVFSSWDTSSHNQRFFSNTENISGMAIRRNKTLKVTIETREDGDSYVNRPTLDPDETKDGILVFEEEQKKIEVNKQSLAAQSAYFDRLFFGNYMEKTMKEIPIGEVKYKEFFNIMLLLYGSDTAHFHCKNALRMLQLADRFELKILEDRAVALLLSASSAAIPMPRKLLIADQYFLPFLMDGLITQLKSAVQLKELSESQEWLQFSPNTHRLLFQKFCI